ncbi:MAG: hypothetical protein P8K08_24815 [Fuerstiella sp.]|nr:hypothetical protein [Fuerstiella sp.]
MASMVVGAYHTATGRFNTKTNESPHPADEQLEKFTSKDPARLLQQADWTIREKDRFPAAAVIQRYSQLGQAARPVFDLMPGYATSQDGALHAEKYYRTVSEECGATPEAFRWWHWPA